MSRLYFDYAKERESLEVIEHEHGFILWRKDRDAFWIRDMYVEPTHRKGFAGVKLFKEAVAKAKELNCKFMEAHVYTEANNPTLSLKAILSAGFKVVYADVKRIILTKEV